MKRLSASDGAAYDNFGISVSISGDSVVVGAYPDWVAEARYQGSAYIFTQDQGGANNWGQVKELIASDGHSNAYFGNSVSISGDRVVVGAFQHLVGGMVEVGSAYIFYQDQGGTNNWGEVKQLAASDRFLQDRFGTSVSISGDSVIIGAPYNDLTYSDQGSAYIFKQDEGGANNWGQVKQLTASDGLLQDYFGMSVSISGDFVAVGADADDVGANTDQGFCVRLHAGLGRRGQLGLG